MLAPAVTRVQVHPPLINKYTAFDINSKKTVVSVPKKSQEKQDLGRLKAFFNGNANREKN
jgi:hypothetical protein